jgi:hypothetical protein
LSVILPEKIIFKSQSPRKLISFWINIDYLLK